MALVLIVILTVQPVLVSAEPSTTADIDIPENAISVCGSGCDYDDIQGAINASPPESTIVVDGGGWSGPIEITQPVRLLGVNDPVIDGHNNGTVVRISAPDTILQGFIVQNSGSNFDKEDSAVYFEAENVQILDNRLLNTLFGVNAATAHDSVIARNEIQGKDVEMGVRGDGIKVWYSHRVQITGNTVHRSRDLLVWYSDDVVVNHNTVDDSRYGFHFMNSDNGMVEDNRIANNSVAVYLMYGSNFTIRNNLLQGSRGPSGHGLGLKEIDGVTVEGNIIYDNRIGVFIDNSPLSPSVYSHFRENLVAFNDIGFGVLPSTRNNVLSRNSMIDNLEQVSVLGGGTLGGNEWSEDGVGNFWSDYVGYDADGDGIGDVAFRSQVLSEEIMSSWPNLQLFRFSVAEAAVNFGSKAVPMFRQEPRLVDDFPLISPVIPANAPTPEAVVNPTETSLWSLVLLVASAGAVWWGVRGVKSGATLTPHTPQTQTPRPGDAETVGANQTPARGTQS